MNTSLSSYEKFIDFLLEISNFERKIEILRQELCNSGDFEPYRAFIFLDSNKKGKILISDIKSFIEKNRIASFSENIYRIFFNYYESNNDGLQYNKCLFK